MAVITILAKENGDCTDLKFLPESIYNFRSAVWKTYNDKDQFIVSNYSCSKTMKYQLK